jgi:hypothetical protein
MSARKCRVRVPLERNRTRGKKLTGIASNGVNRKAKNGR